MCLRSMGGRRGRVGRGQSLGIVGSVEGSVGLDPPVEPLVVVGLFVFERD